MHKRNFKKIAASLSMIAAMTLAVSGCEMIYTIGIEINKDGSAELTGGMLMDDELYEGLAEYSDEDDSEYSDAKKVKRGKKTYYYIEGDDSEDFDDTDELAEFMEDEMNDAFSDVKITKNSFEATFDPEAYMETQEDSAAELEEYDTDIGIEFSVTFPKKVSKTNGELSEDKKTVTWDIGDMDEEYEMYAKCSSVSVPLIIAIVAIIIVIIVVVIIINSKKNNDTDDDDFSSLKTTPAPSYTPVTDTSASVDTPAVAPVENDSARFAPPTAETAPAAEAVAEPVVEAVADTVAEATSEVDPAAPVDDNSDEL